MAIDKITMLSYKNSYFLYILECRYLLKFFKNISRDNTNNIINNCNNDTRLLVK